jgi:hypothetical protein
MNQWNEHQKSSFALERADCELGGTGLLTRGLLLADCAFPPLTGSGCAIEKRPLTVAGQWRLCTALPEHPTSELLSLPHANTDTGCSRPWMDPLESE